MMGRRKINEILNILIMCSFFLFVLPNFSFGQVIFEDDFNSNTSGWVPTWEGAGQHVTGGTANNPGRNEPAPWTGHLWQNQNDYIAIVTGEGRNGTPTLKLGPRPTNQWNAIGVTKWLGPIGYDEIYVRFFIKFADDWAYGNGGSSWAYHKLMRIWQNVSLEDVLGTSGKNMQNEEDRGYMVFTLAQKDGGHPAFNLTATQNDGDNSAAGASTILSYNPFKNGNNQGFLENATGPLNLNTNTFVNTPQTWHCVEVHVKLASAWPADDGVYELWLDGIKQVKYTLINNRDRGVYNPDRIYSNMPSEKLGVGINYIVIHDNGNASQYWSSNKYLWIDDVVISTSYIGPDYVIGDSAPPDTTAPAAPPNTRQE